MLASPRSRKFTLRQWQPSHLPRRPFFRAAGGLGTLLSIAMVVSGCGAARPIRYYQLNVPEIVPAGSSETYPVTIVLGSLTTSHLYREDRIVYGTQGEGMGTYEYQRWAEPPTEMIEAILLRELHNTHHFRQVHSLKSAVRGDYLLHGHLYDFKEISGPNLVARVSFDLELRDNRTGTVVWNTTYRQDEPVSSKDPAAVVAALDKNVERGLHEATASIDQYFAAHPPQPAPTP
jgi:cholesterol transport system auxiliary component